jgi:thymidine phosphorylase
MARELADSLVRVAQGAGLPTRAWITDMNQVLGHSCGNAVEMLEAIDFLTGRYRDPRLLEVTCALGAEMLMIGCLDNDRESALARMHASLESGQAAERFARMVAGLGGPTDLLDNPSLHLVAAPCQRDVLAPRAGWIAGMHTRDIGVLVIELGGGRRMASDHVDHRVGLTQVVGVGQRVEQGQLLARVHAADEAAAQRAEAALIKALLWADEAVPATPALLAYVDGGPA